VHIGKCPFCKKEKPLVESHFIPSAAIKKCQDSGVGPVVITNKVVLFGREIKHPLLCADCEQLLNREGENWTVPLLATSETDFPLIDLVRKRLPDLSGPELNGYFSVNNPEIKTDDLAHFGLAIFWKSAVHGWKKDSNGPWIDLGPYEDALRLYLRKEGPFPKEMALLLTVSTKPVLQALNLPEKTDMQECHHYRFYILGIHYELAVGKMIPDLWKRACFVARPERVIVECEIATLLRKRAGETAGKAHIARTVRAYGETLKKK
jgi:hypothetical protein